MAGYRYRGTEFDAHIPFPEVQKRPPRPRVAAHGTRSGYALHIAAKEKPCEPCRAANREYLAAWKVRAKARAITTGWTGEKCGTLAGFKSHYYHAVPVCDPCRAANAEYCRARRDEKRAA